jgi:gliding motility-associated-like protein
MIRTVILFLLLSNSVLAQVNPGLRLTADHFTAGNPITGIINTYTPVLALNPCENKITVEDAATFNPGDTVLMIQMKGAVIDSTNTAAFGTITDYKNAGNYEFNYVKSKTGNIIELKNNLTRQYDIPDGKIQLVRVPYYQNTNVTGMLTCLPWDGNKGGVLVLNVADTLDLQANIDVSNRGFRGGVATNIMNNSTLCHTTDYYMANDPTRNASKGEGIAMVSPSRSFGRGALANGGGGGLGHNSGGGGGSNGSIGGTGGKEWFQCTPVNNNGGVGGRSLLYNNNINKIFLGGGGGAGQCDNLPGFNSTGGNGGGIIIIQTNFIKANTFTIKADGGGAAECTRNPAQQYKCHEGMGGGGSGGTILLNVNTYLDNIILNIKGGKGADMNGEPVGQLGPGGGGGGGICWFDASTLPGNVSVNRSGGINGVNIVHGNDSYGATSGTEGSNYFDLVIPVDIVLFKPNIDSVRIKDSTTACNSFDFEGLGYTNTSPVISWQWYFGDGGTATTQNTSHTYTLPGTYTVKLLVTDINGCKDSVLVDVTASFLTVDAGADDTICPNVPLILQGNTNGGTIFSWSPAAVLNDPTLLNPTAIINTTTKFYFITTNMEGCSRTDSVLINVRTLNTFTIGGPESICKDSSIQLSAGGGDVYSWQPASTLNNPGIPNPVASPLTTTTYYVQIIDTLCNNTAELSTEIAVKSNPNIQAVKSNDIDCSVDFSLLSASGGIQYSWLPASTLNNPLIANPIAKPTITTKYIVKGTDPGGCVNFDSVTVNVTGTHKGGFHMPTGFTPNNDGLNDCYGVKSWGNIDKLEFSIYNRWGERIFYTTNPSQCWDGTYKGVKQDSNVFIYMIKANTTCEPSVFRKGTFALIR